MRGPSRKRDLTFDGVSILLKRHLTPPHFFASTSYKYLSVSLQIVPAVLDKARRKVSLESKKKGVKLVRDGDRT